MIIGGDILQLHQTILYQLSNVVVLVVYVLHFSIKYQVLR